MVLPHCRDAVGVYHSPSKYNLFEDSHKIDQYLKSYMIAITFINRVKNAPIVFHVEGWKVSSKNFLGMSRTCVLVESARAVEYTDCMSADRYDHPTHRRVSCLWYQIIWWWLSCNAGALEECRAPLYCHCSQVHSSSEW